MDLLAMLPGLRINRVPTRSRAVDRPAPGRVSGRSQPKPAGPRSPEPPRSFGWVAARHGPIAALPRSLDGRHAVGTAVALRRRCGVVGPRRRRGLAGRGDVHLSSGWPSPGGRAM